MPSLTNLNWNLWKIKERDGVSRSKVRAETDREQCAGQRTKSVAVDLLRMICVGPIGRSSEYIRRHITSVSRLIRHWVTEDGKDEKERGDGQINDH